MRYRAFGRTGLKVSELVFGGGKVGGILIFPDDETKLAAVRRALDAGINWIDTAPAYGNGQSESALGWILKEVEQQPHVSTKVTLDPSRLDDIPGEIERSLHASLERLQRESVDLVQLHNTIEREAGGRAVGLDDVLGRKGVADGFERLREQGLTRFVGLTALGETALVRQAIESGRFDSAQVYYNLINPSAASRLPDGWAGQDFSGVIASCREVGAAVLAVRIFAAGVLASDERHGRESVLTRNTTLESEERQAVAVFEALGDAYGNRAQTALRFVLANPDVSCAVLGLAEPAHLEDALAAAEAGPLPEPALRRLEALYGSR